MQDVETFLEELQSATDAYFPDASIQFILKTSKSLKVNVLLKKGAFIAARYNARNGRKDVAVIENDKRIFGYDNLKSWHHHPLHDPESHIQCEEPSMKKVLMEIQAVLLR